MILEDSDRIHLLQQVKAKYPAGTYRQADWLLAEREIRLCLEEGHALETLTAGVERYAAQAAAKESVGTQYVTSPSRFFRERQFLEPFPLPAKKVTATEELLANLDRSARARRKHIAPLTVAQIEADIAAGRRNSEGSWIGPPRTGT